MKMAQFLCIALYQPFTNLLFNCCAIYFDSKVVSWLVKIHSIIWILHTSCWFTLTFNGKTLIPILLHGVLGGSSQLVSG